jgi:DNA-binding NarL/FixJ family response regulator
MTKSFYSPIRVLLADDHELIREGFQVMISRMSALDLVGEAANGEQLVELTRNLMPDVVITDIKMPQMDGIQAARQIHEEFPEMGIIALSSFAEEALIVEMLEAGARGYLLKNANKVEIEEAVQAVYQGDTYYCNQTTQQLARMIASSRHTGSRKNEQPEFSDREVQIIRFISEGLASKEIADRLRLKTRTIESYRENIMEKMGVKNMVGIVVHAIRLGIINVN